MDNNPVNLTDVLGDFPDKGRIPENRKRTVGKKTGEKDKKAPEKPAEKSLEQKKTEAKNQKQEKRAQEKKEQEKKDNQKRNTDLNKNPNNNMVFFKHRENNETHYSIDFEQNKNF